MLSSSCDVPVPSSCVEFGIRGAAQPSPSLRDRGATQTAAPAVRERLDSSAWVPGDGLMTDVGRGAPWCVWCSGGSDLRHLGEGRPEVGVRPAEDRWSEQVHVNSPKRGGNIVIQCCLSYSEEQHVQTWTNLTFFSFTLQNESYLAQLSAAVTEIPFSPMCKHIRQPPNRLREN